MLRQSRKTSEASSSWKATPLPGQIQSQITQRPSGRRKDAQNGVGEDRKQARATRNRVKLGQAEASEGQGKAKSRPTSFGHVVWEIIPDNKKEYLMRRSHRNNLAQEGRGGEIYHRTIYFSEGKQ